MGKGKGVTQVRCLEDGLPGLGYVVNNHGDRKSAK